VAPFSAASASIFSTIATLASRLSRGDRAGVRRYVRAGDPLPGGVRPGGLTDSEITTARNGDLPAHDGAQAGKDAEGQREWDGQAAAADGNPAAPTGAF
jgi:hypothetical protein